MRSSDRDRTYAAFAAVLVVVISADACLAEPPPPRYSDLPVTAERLTGARLEYHRSDPKLVWSFSRERFVLEIGGKTVPEKLIETLTGARPTVARIEGTWTLDQERGELVLTTSTVDGRIVRHQAQLPISPAGLVRVELGDYQYNVFPGKARLPNSQPQLAFRQDGKNLVVTTTIEIVDAPHVLWTHAELVMDHDPYLEGPRRDPRLDSARLSYFVIQCRDDPFLKHRRHRKKPIEITWRLKDHRKSDVPYHVIQAFRPSADDLIELAPKLKRIAEETRNRAPLAVP